VRRIDTNSTIQINNNKLITEKWGLLREPSLRDVVKVILYDIITLAFLAPKGPLNMSRALREDKREALRFD
jgi:hypothetical protein